MRTTIFLSTLYLVFAFFACNKGDNEPGNVQNWTNRISQLHEHNNEKVNIKQGFYGTLTMRDGDCMPGQGPQSSCREYPVVRRIRIYEGASFADVVSDQGCFFKQVDTKLIATISVDKDGFYQYSIKPGTYSLFIEENAKLYANNTDGNIINAATVISDKTTMANVKINYATD